MPRLDHESLSDGIGVKVIQFLTPKWFGLDSNRMLTGLPETSLTILTGTGLQNRSKAFRPMRTAMVRKRATCVLAKRRAIR